MAEFGHPDRHRKDVQNALILIWQENVIWRAFFMINILVTLRGCSDGRIWSSRQTQKRCPECSDLDLARKWHLKSIFHDKNVGDFEKLLGWQNLVAQTDTEKMSRMF